MGFGGFAIPFVRGRDLPVAETEVGQIAGMVTAKLDANLVTSRMGDIPQNVDFVLKGSLTKAFLTLNGI